jgi:hypothetical protein
MCQQYRPGRPGDCDDDRADPPAEKATANFCEFFQPSASAYTRKDGSPVAAARSKLSSLFDDQPEGSVSEGGPKDRENHSKFDDLFKD